VKRAAAILDTSSIRVTVDIMRWSRTTSSGSTIRRRRSPSPWWPNPFHKGYIVPPGRYRASLSLYADNAAPIARMIEFSLTGTWHADPNRMFHEGFDVTVLRDYGGS
jgi:hypothetical protein